MDTISFDFSNNSWSTQSNALLRSMNVAISTFLSSRHFEILSVNFNRACSVLAPDLMQNCEDYNILIVEK